MNIARGTEAAIHDAIKDILNLGVARIAVEKISTTASRELNTLINIAELSVLSPISKFRVQ
jgi:hypothetical protein